MVLTTYYYILYYNEWVGIKYIIMLLFVLFIHTRIGHRWILYETSTNFVCKHTKHRIDN